MGLELQNVLEGNRKPWSGIAENPSNLQASPPNSVKLDS